MSLHAPNHFPERQKNQFLTQTISFASEDIETAFQLALGPCHWSLEGGTASKHCWCICHKGDPCNHIPNNLLGPVKNCKVERNFLIFNPPNFCLLFWPLLFHVRPKCLFHNTVKYYPCTNKDLCFWTLHPRFLYDH